MASLVGLEAAGEHADRREMAFRRIALLNALAIASGGLATTYMGVEAGLLNDHSRHDHPDHAHEGRWLHRPRMDWDALAGETARRVAGNLARSRDERIAGGGAGAPAPIDSGDARVLGIACGRDRVFLNFSGSAVAITARGYDRLSKTSFAATLAPWQVVWLGEDA